MVTYTGKAAGLTDLAACSQMHPELNGSAPALPVDTIRLWRYVCAISERYHHRSFHSFRHGVDVLLATCSLLVVVREAHPEAFDDPLMVGALLVGALAHDADHPGVMNSLLHATSHPLVARHGTVGTLERHHAEVALALLDRPEYNFLAPLPAAEQYRFRELMRANIYATDVATTIPAVRALEKSLSSGTEGGRQPEKPATRQIMEIILKAADISNPARPLLIYRRWVEGVMQEFYAQGDAERARGLPISMNCDRHSVDVSKAQIGFISFLVRPVFNVLLMYAPKLQPLMDQLDQNLHHYQTIAAASHHA